MIKLNVINMDEFLQIVNECVGAVKIIDADGSKHNINRQEERQFDLRRRHHENQQFLRIMLDIPNYKDYMKIIFFTIGDC